MTNLTAAQSVPALCGRRAPADQGGMRTAIHIGSIREHLGGTSHKQQQEAGSSSVAQHILAAPTRTSVAKTPWKLSVKADAYLSSM